jgi:hypothetical protein
MNRTKNGITFEPFNRTNNKEVYRITSPSNSAKYYLVKKKSLMSLIGKRSRIPSIGAMNSLVHAAHNKNFTHVGHVQGFIFNGPVRPNMFHAFPKRTAISNYVIRKWNNNYGRVNVRDPIYGVPLKLKQISMNKISNANLRGARTEKRQNVRNTQEYNRERANKLSRKIVQKVYYRNGHPAVWINSNGNPINVPANKNVERYGSQGGRSLFNMVIKSANRVVNAYHRKHPALKSHYHYRTMMLRKNT